MAEFSEVEIFQAAGSVHIQVTSEEETKIFLTKVILVIADKAGCGSGTALSLQPRGWKKGFVIKDGNSS